MLFAITILSIFMANPSLSLRRLDSNNEVRNWSYGDIRRFVGNPPVPVGDNPPVPEVTDKKFDSFNEGGNWRYGDVRWFVNGDIKCRNAMKPKDNWNGEIHQEITNGGTYHNYPRYYVKNRQASDIFDRQVQFIASRYPLVRGLDDDNVRRDPEPIDAELQPDKFKDLRQMHQMADIFCHDSTIKDEFRIGRIKPTTARERVKDCSIFESLVKLCMSDPKVVIPGSLNRLIFQTFNENQPQSINEQERFNHKRMVEDRCAKFFKVESPSKVGYTKKTWIEQIARYAEGASWAGYESVLYLDNDNVWHNMDTIDMVILKNLVDDKDDVSKRTVDAFYSKKLSLSPFKKQYWYFCCFKTNALCNN